MRSGGKHISTANEEVENQTETAIFPRINLSQVTETVGERESIPF